MWRCFTTCKKSSQHVLGQAADIEVLGVSNLELSDWINTNLEYDQLILEFYNEKEGPHSGWVHVSFDKGYNKHDYKEAYKNEQGQTRYRFDGICYIVLGLTTYAGYKWIKNKWRWIEEVWGNK